MGGHHSTALACLSPSDNGNEFLDPKTMQYQYCIVYKLSCTFASQISHILNSKQCRKFGPTSVLL